MSLTLTLKRGSDTITGEGTDFTLYGTVNGGALDSVQLKGDTTQTTYTGKNLFNKASTNVLYGYFEGDRPSTSVVATTSGTRNYVFWIPCSANTTYTISTTNIDANLMTWQIGTSIDTPANGVAVVGLGYGADTASGLLKTITTGANANYLLVRLQSAAGTDGGNLYNALKDTLQIEANNQQTSYEPYVGGTASPSPDYPQNVNVVSGTQTITITDGGSQSQTKTVRLGSIELCKVGTYQDYIYKSGDDWYVHKETKKLDVSALTGWYYNNNTNFRTLTGVSDIVFPADNNTVGIIICKDYTAQTANSLANGDYDYAIGLGSASYISVRNKDITTLQAFETYLANNQVYAYVALATATDTKITDAELTTDLDRLVEASTYNGQTTVYISGNLAAYLVVESGGTITKTYTESELSSPFTTTDVEGKSQNTTLDGNIYVDFAYNKRQFSVDIFNLTPTDYAEIRAFYTFQFAGTRLPTISIPELEISDMPVFMEISARNIVNQCLLTDRITLKFRETVQP